MRRTLPLLVLLSAFTIAALDAADRTRVLIDADTANEVDDPYAIVRALIAPELEVVGLAAAQWQVSHWTTPTSMEDSHRLNQVLLGYLDRMDIPHPRGAAARLYDWGELAQHSHAAYFLIEMAEVRERFRGRVPLLDFLVDRWVQHVDPGRRSRTIWDLAVIEALLHPEMAPEEEVQTPPECTPRRVWMHTSIDAAAMKADFFAAAESYFD